MIVSCRDAVYSSYTISFTAVLFFYSVSVCVCVCVCMHACVRTCMRVCVCDNYNYRPLCSCSTLYSNERKHYAKIVVMVATVDYQCMQ